MPFDTQVVDAPSFFDRLSQLTRVKDQPEAEGVEVDQANNKVLSELMVEQVEFADVILVNKCDVLEAQGEAGAKELA